MTVQLNWIGNKFMRAVNAFNEDNRRTPPRAVLAIEEFLNELVPRSPLFNNIENLYSPTMDEDERCEMPVGREFWLRLGEAGLIAAAVPISLGGTGLGMAPTLELVRLLASRAAGGSLLAYAVQSLIAPTWMTHASMDVRVNTLSKLLSGTVIACQCDTDTSEEQRTTADYKGHLIEVTGRKKFVIAAPIADLFFVTTRIGGTSAIAIIERDNPGLSVSPAYSKLGTSDVESADVILNRALVHESSVITAGPLMHSLAWTTAMSHMRLCISVAAATMHARLLLSSWKHGANRSLGGRPQMSWPVNLHQWVSGYSAFLLMRGGIQRAISSINTPNAASHVAETAQLKWFCVDAACRFAEFCCDLEGGLGYMSTSNSLRFYRQLRGFRMAGGSQTTMLTIANHSLACRSYFHR